MRQKVGNQTQTINRTKASGEERGSFERLQKPQFWQNFGILAARWKKSVPTIVWWHCVWFRRRPRFILSLWLSLRIHNCYLMARKEIANKYSLLSRSLIFPVNNKDICRLASHGKLEICTFDMLSQSVIKFDPLFHIFRILWRVNWLWSDLCVRWQWRHVRPAARAPCAQKGEAWTLTACRALHCTLHSAYQHASASSAHCAHMNIRDCRIMRCV